MKNKYQGALDYLKGGNLFGELSNDALEGIEELVDKETPMKLLKSQFDGYRECGNCNSIIVSTNHDLPNFCSNCGQKIDWNDNK